MFNDSLFQLGMSFTLPLLEENNQPKQVDVSSDVTEELTTHWPVYANDNELIEREVYHVNQ